MPPTEPDYIECNDPSCRIKHNEPESSWAARQRAIAREVIEANAADTGKPLDGFDEDSPETPRATD